MRFISPSLLVFALVLFMLPWIEVRCEANTPQRGNNPFGGVGASLSAFYQSGLQATWGEVSINGWLSGQAAGLSASTDPAPLLIVYGLCLIPGISIGYAMRSSKRKGFLLGGVCLTASALLLAQMVVGFPFAKTFEKEHAARLGAFR